MQATRKAVRTSVALVELAARMQAGKDQLDHRGTFFRVQAKGNATAVVFHTDGAVGVQGEFDFFAESGQSLVGGVVDHLLQDVQGVVGTGVHAGTLLDGLQALEHAD